jgi:hypothetical protein
MEYRLCYQQCGIVVAEEYNECNGQWDGRGWQDLMSSKEIQ